VVKRTITPRFERGIPGSNPGWGTEQFKVQNEEFKIEDMGWVASLPILNSSF
jgi:hypothetical protein